MLVLEHSRGWDDRAIRSFELNYKHLSTVRGHVVTEARKAGFSETTLVQLEMALDEGVANIMEHSGNGEVTEFAMATGMADGHFRVLLVYVGPHFDPTEKDTSALNLVDHFGTRKTGGLGLYIMKRFFDRMEYRRLADSTNLLFVDMALEEEIPVLEEL